MPLFKLKKVVEYCSYNIPFFVLILVLIFVLNSIRDFTSNYLDSDYIAFALYCIITIVLFGYGLSITRDRINHGHRLPKIMFGDVISLGIKSVIVYAAFLILQYLILRFTSYVFDIPFFDLEDLLLNFRDTIHMFAVNEPLHILKFVVVGGLAFYISTFFVELGLARLADTKSLLSAFNPLSMYRSIMVIGLKEYVLECTSIILAIVILTFAQYIPIPNYWMGLIWLTILEFLIFATQYLGIGALYADIKDKEMGLNESEN